MTRLARIFGSLTVMALIGYAAQWAGLAPDLILGAAGMIGLAQLLGTGYAPPTGAIGNEIEAITRRSFIPAVIVQIGQATPLLAALLSNAQPASGGLSSVTVPVQANAMVTPQATDYFASFSQPTITPGVVDAAYNLAATVCPIGFLGFEGLIQQDAAIIPRIEVVMNDVGNQTALFLNTDLWTNATYGTLHMDGLPLIAKNTGLYGNIDRSAAGNGYWQANVRSEGGGLPPPTRKTIAVDIASAASFNGGEAPNIGMMNLAMWAQLQQDFLNIETMMITPANSFDKVTQGARSGFSALMINGIPFYADLGVPAGTLYLLNTRYLSLYIHESAAFAFTGFASTLPVLQIGYIGAMILICQLICSRPKSVTICTGYGQATL